MKDCDSQREEIPLSPSNGPELVSKLAQESGAKLTRERQRTNDLMESLPKGITIGSRRDDRGKPFFVRFGNPRKTKSYETERDRNDEAEELGELQREQGTSALAYSKNDWAEFQEWRAKYKRPVHITRDAVTKYMAFRLKEDVTEDSDSHVHLVTQLEKRFCAEFGDMRLDYITADNLRDWLDSLTDPRKKGNPKLGPVTLRHYRKNVNMLFKRAVGEGWIDRNPCEPVKTQKVKAKKKKPLPVKDLFQLLKANLNFPVVGRMALEIWGALRCSAVEDLNKDDLDFEKKSIRILRQKVGDEKTRQGHFPVLWEWLTIASEECWEMNAPSYDNWKTQAFIRAGVTNHGNALRHTGVSYYLALWKDYKRVGYLFQHTSISTTMGYEGAATDEDALLYTLITPKSVEGTWEDFLASQKQP